MKRVLLTEKQLSAIADEWDQIAEVRHRQISGLLDDSLVNVLGPAVVQLIHGTDSSQIIDIGCGTGWLTCRLACFAHHVIGVDISRKSLDIANRTYRAPNSEFVQDDFIEFSYRYQDAFTLAVANMSLMTILDLPACMQAVRRVLKDAGYFLFTVPHPFYWPLYWGYFDCQWFSYLEEVAIEAPFRIGAERTEAFTTHIHRPLQCYSEAVYRSGFLISEVMELTGKGFKLPRFLAFKCMKVTRAKD